MPVIMADENRKYEMQVISLDRQLFFERSVVERNGKIWFAEYYIKPVKDKNGKIIGTAGIIRDITERKISDMELLQRKERKMQ